MNTKRSTSSRRTTWSVLLLPFLGVLLALSSSLLISPVHSAEEASVATIELVKETLAAIENRKNSNNGAGGDEVDDASGNFFFGFIFDPIGYFFECTLGITNLLGFIPIGLLFPSGCVCNEAVLRREIGFALLFDVISICANTDVVLSSDDPIDIDNRGFVLYCQDIDSPTCSITKKNGNNPIFKGAPNAAGISDFKVTSTGGFLELTGKEALVRRMEIEGGSVTGNGGAIRVMGADTDLVFEDSVVTGNAATGNGGAMYVSQSTKVTIAGVQFRQNSAAGEGGGALALANGASVSIGASDRFAAVFEDNTATNTANDIYIEDAASSATCLPKGTGVQFCDGVATGMDNVTNGRTDCDTTGTDGPPATGSLCT